MADVLGVGQNFEEINVSIHKSLVTNLDFVKKRDIRQGSLKLPAMCAETSSEHHHDGFPQREGGRAFW